MAEREGADGGLPDPYAWASAFEDSRAADPGGSRERTAVADLPPVSVAVLTHDAAPRIRECLDAVLRQSHAPEEILVVDNASQDDTVEIVRREYPGVRIVRSGRNTGCSGGRQRQISSATHRHVLIVDDDAFLARRCLERLAEAAGRLTDGAIWAPRVVYDHDRNTVQYDGGDLHFVGEIVAINPERRRDPDADDADDERDAHQIVQPQDAGRPLPTEPFVTTIQGGVAYLIDRDAALSLGGYDESYYFGRSDGEISLRLTLAGRRVYTVPRAVVYHRFTPRGLANVRNQVRNRWMLILTTYSARTLLVLSPALLAYEVLLLAFLTLRRVPHRYVAGNADLLRSLPRVLRRRRAVLATKRRSDRELLTSGFMNMRADAAGGGGAVRVAYRLVNRFFQAYWALARRLVA